MKQSSLTILRIGLGITFLLIGISIWKNPEIWGSFMRPWAQDLLLLPLATTMKVTAILDIVIGVFLILNIFTWAFAFLGALHLLIVIITVGFNDISFRDFGLLAASIVLSIETIPKQIRKNIFS